MAIHAIRGSCPPRRPRRASTRRFSSGAERTVETGKPAARTSCNPLDIYFKKMSPHPYCRRLFRPCPGHPPQRAPASATGAYPRREALARSSPPSLPACPFSCFPWAHLLFFDCLNSLVRSWGMSRSPFPLSRETLAPASRRLGPHNGQQRRGPGLPPPQRGVIPAMNRPAMIPRSRSAAARPFLVGVTRRCRSRQALRRAPQSR